MFRDRLVCLAGLLLLPLASPQISAGQSTTACTYGISPPAIVVPSAGTNVATTGTVSIQTSDPSCTWTVFRAGALSTSVSSGTGPATLSYKVETSTNTEQGYLGVAQTIPNGYIITSNFAVSTVIALGSNASSPRVTTSALPNAVNGQQLFGGRAIGTVYGPFQLSATGGITPYKWTYYGLEPPNTPTYPLGLFTGTSDGVVSSNGPLYFEAYDGPLIQGRTALDGITAYVTDSAGATATAYIPILISGPTCQGAGGDTDGDGLCDDWETNGLVVNGVKLDLPAMGANPLHKDIFVQADYMARTDGHSHQLNSTSEQHLIYAFEHAPVTNPDGLTGIHLHIDCGPLCFMDPINQLLWGSRSQAHSLPERNPSDPILLKPPYVWDLFDLFKSGNLAAERVPVFHYAIQAHFLTSNSDHTSGQSRGNYPEGASDFVTALGFGVDGIGSYKQQEGTFMHELGHNLGLAHGGNEPKIRKPNYLSVMNYLFQTTGLSVDDLTLTLDYSRFILPSLDEQHLSEFEGLKGVSGTSKYKTRYYCQSVFLQPPKLIPDDVYINYPIDWNCNSIIDSGIVSAAISNCGQNLHCNTNEPVYASFQDWINLVYKGGSIGGSGEPLLTMTPVEDELSITDDDAAVRPFRVDVTTPLKSTLAAGANSASSFTVLNGGSQNDTYIISVQSSVPWWDTSVLPTTLTLAPQTSQIITIPVTTPHSASAGTTASLTLKATSTRNQFLSPGIGTAEITVTSGGGSPNLSGSVQLVGASIARLQITNTGSSPAVNATLSGTTVQLVTGSGNVSLAAQFPISLGTIAPGGNVMMDIPFTSDPTVTAFSLTEHGIAHDSTGNVVKINLQETVQK